ncbi:hypothetical protein DFQ28_008294 [Apophysomyces sp. BC1034]|nr:hypothetical protein DFQ28_008294 [Apophysomyces sp. BC1034]
MKGKIPKDLKIFHSSMLKKTPLEASSQLGGLIKDTSNSTNAVELLNHSHLKTGPQASLLSYKQTIRMYRENAKKTRNPMVRCEFAIFLAEAAKSLGNADPGRPVYLAEAEKLLRRLASQGYADAQYYLGNLYGSGLLDRNQKSRFDRAFRLFVQASKHHHADAAYRKSASLNHPGAMYRLGMATVHGQLGLASDARNGVKWLKRAASAATKEYPQAVHELALLHERGASQVVFQDLAYCIQLYTRAADDLAYAPSAFRLGKCYEDGQLGCDKDPTLSIHYYTLAARQDHTEACFALTTWYLTGAPGVLAPSEQEAYSWAHRAAENNLPKAQYAVGYFMEIGIGVKPNPEIAMQWYRRAAKAGDPRALAKLKEGNQPLENELKIQKCSVM